MKKLCLLSILSFALFLSKASIVDSIFYKFSLTKAQLDSTLNANGVPPAFVGTIYDIDVYKVRYKTVSYDSSIIYASGLLAFPTNVSCRLPLGSFGHGTTSDREGVPSRANGGEAMIGMVMASLGYVGALPDYIGLGDSPDSLLHPYQDARTEASATIDVLRAARELAPQLHYRLNDQLFLAGYSQGGHTTMATHRKIQTDLSDEFTVTASCPMSGPYDLSGVMKDVMLSDSDYAVPGYLPFLVFSWNQRYHFYNSPSEFLQAPYDTLLPPLFDGQHSIGYINNFTPSVPKHIFKPEVIDSFSNNPNHPFRQALADNDVYDWKPTSPVRIEFCRADQEVNWHNAVTLYNAFKANGATNVDTVCMSETLPHFDCAQFAILGMKAFFASYQALDSCATVGVNEIAKNTFSIYPNPAVDELTLASEQETTITRLMAVNALGQQVEVSFTPGIHQVRADVKKLPAGIYFLRAIADGKEVNAGRFMKL